MRIILLIMLTFILTAPLAKADVNFRLNFSGVPDENTYFFCMSNTGCFSILNAKKGKIYTVDHNVGIREIFIMDVIQDMRVFAQPLPASCALSHISDKTITVSGNIVKGDDGAVLVENMQCSVN